MAVNGSVALAKVIPTVGAGGPVRTTICRRPAAPLGPPSGPAAVNRHSPSAQRTRTGSARALLIWTSARADGRRFSPLSLR
jgi:hypothetical protein